MTVLVTILCSDNARALLTKNVSSKTRSKRRREIIVPKSTGFELSIGDGIVTSEPGKGSVFTVRLPGET
jgi:signal transduction histidine kinase